MPLASLRLRHSPTPKKAKISMLPYYANETRNSNSSFTVLAGRLRIFCSRFRSIRNSSRILLYVCLLWVLVISRTKKSISSLRISSDELPRFDADYLSQTFRTESEILDWVCEKAQKKSFQTVQMTSFGPSSLVILDMLQKRRCLDAIPTATIDTLHLFPETYTFWLTTQNHFPSMKLHIYSPDGGYKTTKDFDSYFAYHRIVNS